MNTHNLPPFPYQVDVLPHLHGSAMFQRGETQTLCITTMDSSERGRKVGDADCSLPKLHPITEA